MVFTGFFISKFQNLFSIFFFLDSICKYNIVHRKAPDGMQSSDSEQNFIEFLNCDYCISLLPLNF